MRCERSAMTDVARDLRPPPQVGSREDVASCPPAHHFLPFFPLLFTQVSHRCRVVYSPTVQR